MIVGENIRSAIPMEKSRTLFYTSSPARLTKGNMLLQIMAAEWELKYKRPAMWYATEWTLYRIYQEMAWTSELEPRMDFISRELEKYAENKKKPDIEKPRAADPSKKEGRAPTPKPPSIPLPPTLALLGWNIFFEPVFEKSELVHVHFYLIDARRNLTQGSFFSITKLLYVWFVYMDMHPTWDFTVFTYDDAYQKSYRKQLKLGDPRLSEDFKYIHHDMFFKTQFKGLSFVSLDVGRYFNHIKKTSAADTPEAKAERVQKALAILDASKPKKKPPHRKQAKPKQLTMKQLMAQRLAKLKAEKAAAEEVFDFSS